MKIVTYWNYCLLESVPEGQLNNFSCKTSQLDNHLSHATIIYSVNLDQSNIFLYKPQIVWLNNFQSKSVLFMLFIGNKRFILVVRQGMLENIFIACFAFHCIASFFVWYDVLDKAQQEVKPNKKWESYNFCAKVT